MEACVIETVEAPESLTQDQFEEFVGIDDRLEYFVEQSDAGIVESVRADEMPISEENNAEDLEDMPAIPCPSKIKMIECLAKLRRYLECHSASSESFQAFYKLVVTVARRSVMQKKTQILTLQVFMLLCCLSIFTYLFILLIEASWKIKVLKYSRHHKTDTITETPSRQHRIKANITWKHPLGPHDIVYPYDYNYVINEPDKCKNKNPFLVLLIPTGPAEIHARNVIRETWGNETLIPRVTIIRLFFIGLPVKIVEPLQQHLEEESSVHHDIIQRDFLESYSNLTIKTMTSLEWLADFCPEADYAMKVDADMFLNIEKLVKSLLNLDIPTRQNYFTGAPFIHHRPFRDKNSKWYMPKNVFPGKEYPPFCSGTGYVFSVNITWKILEASYVVKPIYLEDVYIGLCLNFAQINITIPPDSFFNIYHIDYEAFDSRVV
ncbi:beta-1,3-galactosyltransferase 2-like [Latimeria chalumnae]|uniref:beta-1,3-galactosyltransferase 2-like n=1 Tax=Latimeria chalumnae TaxID=7897 RepID=UPI00313DB0F0